MADQIAKEQDSAATIAETEGTPAVADTQTEQPDSGTPESIADWSDEDFANSVEEMLTRAPETPAESDDESSETTEDVSEEPEEQPEPETPEEKELTPGEMRQADYTRKTQELAEMRKEQERVMEEVRELRADLKARLEQAKEKDSEDFDEYGLGAEDGEDDVKKELSSLKEEVEKQRQVEHFRQFKTNYDSLKEKAKAANDIVPDQFDEWVASAVAPVHIHNGKPDELLKAAQQISEFRQKQNKEAYDKGLKEGKEQVMKQLREQRDTKRQTAVKTSPSLADGEPGEAAPEIPAKFDPEDFADIVEQRLKAMGG